MPGLDVRPLTPERLADFLGFMEGAAFADNPKWKSCYCQFLYVDHQQVNWVQRTAVENRSGACARVCAGQMQGYLAYLDGQVVGWCNAAPRTLMDAFSDAPDPQDPEIGQIGCFVVARTHRRTGVAAALLQAACDGLQAQGMRIAQASPKPEACSDAENHYGPLSLFTSVGFQLHGPGEHGCVLVRRPLGSPDGETRSGSAGHEVA